MSDSVQSLRTPTAEFQAHFGGLPGSSDLAAECKKWENLCGDLLAERQKLREELAQMQREYDACRKTLFHLKCKDYTPPEITDKEALAYVDLRPSIHELIAELRNVPEK
jgi:predicted nuclease with TOPRIM domain